MREEGSKDVILEVIGKHVSIYDQESYNFRPLVQEINTTWHRPQAVQKEFCLRGMVHCVNYRHTLLCQLGPVSAALIHSFSGFWQFTFVSHPWGGFCDPGRGMPFICSKGQHGFKKKVLELAELGLNPVYPTEEIQILFQLFSSSIKQVGDGYLARPL